MASVTTCECHWGVSSSVVSIRSRLKVRRHVPTHTASARPEPTWSRSTLSGGSHRPAEAKVRRPSLLARAATRHVAGKALAAGREWCHRPTLERGLAGHRSAHVGRIGMLVLPEVAGRRRGGQHVVRSARAAGAGEALRGRSATSRTRR